MKCNVVIIDHGVGNLRSVEKALASVGANVVLSNDLDTIMSADKVVLPGVGAFGDCMNGLQDIGASELVCSLAFKKPLLGICVGMQMFFEYSDELGVNKGLGILPGIVTRFNDTSVRVPHTGWNQVDIRSNNILLDGISTGSYAYFNLSYYCVPNDLDDVVSDTEYGDVFCSVVGRGNLYCIQCHPEKSQDVGLQILQNFVEKG